MKVEDENRSVQNRSGSGIMTFKKWLYKLRIFNFETHPHTQNLAHFKGWFQLFSVILSD